jgi:hypothetical protein
VCSVTEHRKRTDSVRVWRFHHTLTSYSLIRLRWPATGDPRPMGIGRGSNPSAGGTGVTEGHYNLTKVRGGGQ